MASWLTPPDDNTVEFYASRGDPSDNVKSRMWLDYYLVPAVAKSDSRAVHRARERGRLIRKCCSGSLHLILSLVASPWGADPSSNANGSARPLLPGASQTSPREIAEVKDTPKVDAPRTTVANPPNGLAERFRAFRVATFQSVQAQAPSVTERLASTVTSPVTGAEGMVKI